MALEAHKRTKREFSI